jgi:hypothetical protein
MEDYLLCRDGYIPKEGFVPNDSTAIKNAEAIWLPIYGKDVLRKKPFTARLVKGVWIVEGHIHYFNSIIKKYYGTVTLRRTTLFGK